jgi:hypothetical protein
MQVMGHPFPTFPTRKPGGKGETFRRSDYFSRALANSLYIQHEILELLMNEEQYRGIIVRKN